MVNLERNLNNRGGHLDPSVLVNVTSERDFPDDITEEDEPFQREELHSPKLQKGRSGKSMKGLRRMDTARTDKTSTSVKNSGGNPTGAIQSMASLFEEKVEEEKPPHPFDAMFGPRVNQVIQANQEKTLIGLTLREFKEVAWPNVFPNFICDLIEVLTGFSMQ